MEFDFRGFQDRRMRPEDFPWDRVLMVAPVVIVLVIVVLLMMKSVYTVDPDEKRLEACGEQFPNHIRPALTAKQYHVVPRVSRNKVTPHLEAL